MKQKELRLQATQESMDEVNAFVEGFLDEIECSPKAAIQLMVAVEELYINIASYAYAPDTGDALMLMRAAKDIMYAMVNSNAMNAEVIGYNPPLWHNYLQYINIGLCAVVVLWGVLAFVLRARKNKKYKAWKANKG